MPTLTEAANLPHVIPKLPEWIYELILVDGYSEDDTVEIARALEPDVRIVYQTVPGKGNAIMCGLAAARGDVAILLDSDGSTDPGEIDAFVDAIMAGADFVKGSRFLPGAATHDITVIRRLGNHFLTRLVNLLFATRYTDLCYGYNAIRVGAVDRLALDVDGFEIETLMNIRAARAGLTVVEVPSTEGRRLHGTTKLRTFRDGWRVLKTIVREWRHERRFGFPSPVEADASDDVLARAHAEDDVVDAIHDLSPRRRAAAKCEAAWDLEEAENARSKRASSGLS